MRAAIFYIFFSITLFCLCGTNTATAGNSYVASPDNTFATGKIRIFKGHSPQKAPKSPNADNDYKVGTYNAAGKDMVAQPDTKAILILLLQCFFAGLLAVFTPYMYTIHPFTTGYLSRNTKSKGEKIRNTLIYAFSLVFIFALLGVLVSLIIKFTGLSKFTEHWIFNVFFFRIFLMLGISFLGAFAIKLPASWINAMAKQAKSNNIRGIFFMAFTLPGASFSSTFPIIGLVLLFACNVGVVGPIVGLVGFALGLGLPFIFPGILNIFVKSKSVLNNIKVIMGFFSLMIALKFMSKADISLGLNLISRELFIEIWMMIWGIMGIYMLGMIKLSHDTETELNIYGQEYIPLTRLFIAIVSLTFALYLLPGIWGAPLRGVSGFLPPI